MENGEYFVPKSCLESLKKYISRFEPVAIIGIPSSGKTRLVKRAIKELDIESQYEFINVGAYTSEQTDLSLLQVSIDNSYKIGKRVFFLEGIDLDCSNVEELFDFIDKVRLSKVEKIETVISLTCSPSLSTKRVMKSNNLWRNIITINIQDLNFIKENLKDNQIRYGVNLSTTETKRIIELTGSIPIFVKKTVSTFASTKKSILDIDYSSDIEAFLNSLTVLEINALKQVYKGKILELNVQKHLETVGLLKDNRIASSLINDSIDKYSKQLIPQIFNNKVFLNLEDISNQFTAKELTFLTLLKSKSIVEKSAVFKIVSRSETLDDYSDYLVEKFVSRLRSKLSGFGISKAFIKTSRKHGFTL